MDEQRFDQWSRRVAGMRTRRQALKAVAGAIVASVSTRTIAGAQTCAAPYATCDDDAACCAGAVCEHGLCMPGCRIEGSFVTAWSSPASDICQVCAPDISTTSWSAANEGMSCWSGDPNAGITTCQSGVCTSTGPIDCRPLTPCHTATINQETGQCEQGVAPAGTECGSPGTCHGGFYQPADTCDGNGFCIGGGSRTENCYPYQCGEASCLTTCAGDSDCAPGNSCFNGVCLDFCTCDAAVIGSAWFNPELGVFVDDDVTVYVNGASVYVDDNGTLNTNVIPIGPVTAGDVIRVVASDPEHGDNQYVSPLYLHCADLEAPRLLQTLTPDSYSSSTNIGEPPGVFYDRSFTVTCGG